MEIVLAIATIFGGISALWYFWDKWVDARSHPEVPPSSPQQVPTHASSGAAVVAHVDATGNSRPIAADSSPKKSGEKPSIAVLAFDNMSGDPAQGYFCDGISEDIITDLSKIDGLAVIGRQSSFTYKGKANDVRRVGQELGVRYVLEGSVRKVGSQVRVSAQLVESETGTHLWANRYDREWENAFLMGDEIAEDIVTSLDIKLGRGEDVRIWRKATRSPKARDVFYQGQDAYYRSTQKDNRRARELFLEVIRLEPESAQAYAGAAMTHALDAVHGWSTDSMHSLEEAKRLAHKAVELDDDNAGAHDALGFVSLFEGRHEEALAEGARALELRPMCSGPNASLAYIQLYSGQWNSALSYARTAVALNPVFPGWYLYLMGAAEYFGGRHQQSLATLSQALAVSPGRLVARVLRIAALDAVHSPGDAKAEAVLLLGDHPDFSISRFSVTQPLSDKSRRDQYLAALRRSGLPD